MTALPNDLTSLGMPPALASRVGMSIRSVTGVGTAQNGSSPVINGGEFVMLTTAASQTACTISANFPVGETSVVTNITATSALLFPPTGCTIDGGSANASVAIAQNRERMIFRATPTLFYTLYGS